MRMIFRRRIASYRDKVSPHRGFVWHALHGAQGAVQAEFADEQEVRKLFVVQRAVGSEDGDGNGQVEAGPFLLQVRRREIDGDARGRKVEARVLDGSADAVAALADSGVGQTHGVKLLLGELDRGEVDFDLNEVGVDTIDGGAADFEEGHVPD